MGGQSLVAEVRVGGHLAGVALTVSRVAKEARLACGHVTLLEAAWLWCLVGVVGVPS